VRTVLELAGVRNILAKQLGSNNPLNNARAAINALDSLRTFAEVAQERGVPIENLYA
jgi:small subunit ribosomal protein S5